MTLDPQILAMIAKIALGMGKAVIPAPIAGGIETVITGYQEVERVIDARAEAAGKTRAEILANWEEDFSQVSDEIRENNGVYARASPTA